jgi:acetyl-CoA carboxylase carboxyl transferase subunit beta
VSDAVELLRSIADDGSVVTWDVPVEDPPEVRGDEAYAAALEAARRRTGLDESVVTGSIRVDGCDVAVVASEFGFLGGSLGVVAADRVRRAVVEAAERRLPLLLLPASGGTRMQEGTAAFHRMVGIARALRQHRDAGLASVAYLRHPTTGGALASWGSGAQLTWAQPGALVGFLGPRVVEALTGDPMPAGVQVAENLHARGVLDEIVPTEHLRTRVAALLRIVAPPTPTGAGRGSDDGRIDGPELLDPWSSVQATRAPERPGLADLLSLIDDQTVVRSPGHAVGAVTQVRLCRIGGRAVVLIGQDRNAERDGHRIGAADLRTALRGIALAGELDVPVATLVDTGGAELSAVAEEDGLAACIAACIAALTSASVPSVTLLLGQGGGGAALALTATDRVLAIADAWLAPLPPEGARALLADADPADVARRQRIGAPALARSGIVDRIVDVGAPHAEGWMRRIHSELAGEVARLDGAIAGREQRHSVGVGG